MSQIPIIQKKPELTDETLVLKVEVHIPPGGPGPMVNFFWNETWASQANPAWPQQVFLVALQALWAAGLTILGKVPMPGMEVRNTKTGPSVN
jgi:hypothetical protein